MAQADPLTAKQCAEFVRHARESGRLLYAALFSFQLATLARIEEARRIRRGDLLEDNHVVRRHISREVVKKKRTVLASFVMPDPARDVLAEWLAFTRRFYGLIRSTDKVFVRGFHGKVINPRTVNRMYKTIARECGFKEHVSSHTPRVSGAIKIYHDYMKKGDDSLAALRKVQDMLCHGSIDTTIRYLRLQRADRNEAAEFLGEMLE